MPKKSKEEKIYIPKGTAELLPFVCIDKGLFYMNDKSYVDFMQIVTKDLISASESEIEFDMLQFEKFYKMYAADCKIIGINFPTDTKRQQQCFQHKINTTDDSNHKIVQFYSNIDKVEAVEKIGDYTATDYRIEYLGIQKSDKEAILCHHKIRKRENGQ